jgi:hypothetical protein
MDIRYEFRGQRPKYLSREMPTPQAISTLSGLAAPRPSDWGFYTLLFWRRSRKQPRGYVCAFELQDEIVMWPSSWCTALNAFTMLISRREHARFGIEVVDLLQDHTVVI